MTVTLAPSTSTPVAALAVPWTVTVKSPGAGSESSSRWSGTPLARSKARTSSFPSTTAPPAPAASAGAVVSTSEPVVWLPCRTFTARLPASSIVPPFSTRPPLVRSVPAASTLPGTPIAPSSPDTSAGTVQANTRSVPPDPLSYAASCRPESLAENFSAGTPEPVSTVTALSNFTVNRTVSPGP